MNLFKKLSVLLAGVLMLVAGAKAQTDIHAIQVDTIKGKAGRVLLLKEFMGFGNCYLSHNRRFVYGASGDDAESASFIFELATGQGIILPNCVVGEVIDFDNYVSTKSIVRNGRETFYETNGLSCETPIYASADLNVIAMGTSIREAGGNLYTMVVFDGQGQLIDTMPHFESNLTTGYGSLLWSLSANGLVGAGKSSVNGAFSNNSPAFWDRVLDSTFSLADLLSGKTDGELNYANVDGTQMAGNRSDVAIYVTYERASKKVNILEVLPEPGYSISNAGCVEGDNIIGYDQISSPDVYSRKPWIYPISKNRKYFMAEYLSNLYGLDMESDYPIFTTHCINEEATVISGFSYEGTAWFPYVILLDEEQVHSMPRSVTARQVRGTMNAEIKWIAAMQQEHTVARYNIYRDNVLAGTVPASEEENYSYLDRSVDTGVHVYRMQAIFTDGKASDTTEAIRIQVIDVNTQCLPVRDISAEVVYNRTVNVRWGLPSSEMSKVNSSKAERDQNSIMKIAAPKGSGAKYIPTDNLDKVSLINTLSQSSSAAVRIGDYYYVTNYRGNVVSIFNTLNGERVRTFEVAGLGEVYDVTYHNNVFYCVGNTNRVYELRLDANDPFKLSLGNQWRVPEGIKLNHIAYVEGENNGNDMLMLGSYDNILFYNLNPAGADDTVSGFASRFDISDLVVSGSAYHNGRVYFAHQKNAGQDPFVEVFDFATGKHLFTSDLSTTFPDLVSAADYPQYPITMAGLTNGVMEDGTVVLECMVQPLVDYNYIATVEIESAPDVLGYNLYRNGTKINDEPLQTRHYSEEIFEPGEYVYSVEFLAENGATAMSEDKDNAKVQIFSIGECDAPTHVNVVESNKMATITWDLPAHTDGFVGFNIYRDSVQIAENIADVRFIDRGPIEKGMHLYRVEAFYDNSCAASDTMKIEFTFEGRPMPPAAVVVKSQKVGENAHTHTTTWELPFFEEPLAMGYCGMPVQSVGLEGTTTLFAAVGWVQEDMVAFDDLYLVGIEYVLGVDVLETNAVVWVDNKMVYNEPISDRQRPREWVSTYLNTSFPMKQQEEIVVGYRVRISNDGDAVFGLDADPTVKPGKTDLVSPDGEEWYSLNASGANANLCINALVVRKRDLEQAAKTENPQAYLEEHVMRFSSEKLNLTDAQPMTPVKSTSEAYTLKGFNVYRDKEKMNEEMLTSFSFVEQNVPDGEYEYQVSAVYADGEEFSESLFYSNIDVANRTNDKACPVAFYPNPVQDMLNIKGEYRSLQLVDMTGRVVMDNISGVQSLSMANVNSGVYFINLTAVDGSQYTVKIVKR